jgi:hypothetical protein
MFNSIQQIAAPQKRLQSNDVIQAPVALLKKWLHFILPQGSRNLVGCWHKLNPTNRATLVSPLEQSQGGFIKVVNLDRSDVICHLKVPH